MACTATLGNGNIPTWQLLRTMSGSVALLQPGCVLKSEAHVAIKGHTETWGLACNLWLCWGLGAVLLEPC